MCCVYYNVNASSFLLGCFGIGWLVVGVRTVSTPLSQAKKRPKGAPRCTHVTSSMIILKNNYQICARGLARTEMAAIHTRHLRARTMMQVRIQSCMSA